MSAGEAEEESRDRGGGRRVTPGDEIKTNAALAADRDRFAEMTRKWGEGRAQVLVELANVYNLAAYVCPPLRETFENLVDGLCDAFELPEGSAATVLPGDRRDFVRDCIKVAAGRMFEAEKQDGKGGIEFVSRTHGDVDPSKLS
jgi:hypothetical protein